MREQNDERHLRQIDQSQRREDARVRAEEQKFREQQELEDKARHTAQISQLEKQLNEARTTMEKYLRDYDTLYQRTQKLTEDLDEQMYHNSQLALENTNIETVTAELTTVFSESEHQAVYSTKG